MSRELTIEERHQVKKDLSDLQARMARLEAKVMMKHLLKLERKLKLLESHERELLEAARSATREFI